MASASDPEHIMAHVQDAYYFEVPHYLSADGRIEIPQPFADYGLRISKFMILELVAAVVVALFAIWVARRMTGGRQPRGRMWNFVEAILVYLKKEVAEAAIGHDAHRFLPFLWTMFFFVLVCNLLGMLPWLGSPTGALGVTGALAAITLCVVVGSGMAKLGPVGFWAAQVPHVELPPALNWTLKPLMFVIEVMGLLIKHFVLAMRLFANMFAGHLVLAVILSFIALTASSVAWYGVMPASVMGAVALSLLELFVAFLQAFVLTFLAALFIGMAVHGH